MLSFGLLYSFQWVIPNLILLSPTTHSYIKIPCPSQISISKIYRRRGIWQGQKGLSPETKWLHQTTHCFPLHSLPLPHLFLSFSSSPTLFQGLNQGQDSGIRHKGSWLASVLVGRCSEKCIRIIIRIPKSLSLCHLFLASLSFSFIFCQIGIEILSLGPVVKSIYMKVYCKLLSVIDKSIIMKVTEHGACWFCLVTDYYPP